MGRLRLRRSLKRLCVAQISLILALTGCGQETARIFPASPASHAGSSFASPQNLRVDHVVVIIQENRTVDYLFNGLPGADTVAQAKLPNGRDVALQPVALSAPYGISHRHNAFTLEYDHGRLDGFDKVGTHCQIRHGCPLRYLRAYGYAPHAASKTILCDGGTVWICRPDVPEQSGAQFPRPSLSLQRNVRDFASLGAFLRRRTQGRRMVVSPAVATRRGAPSSF